MNVSMTSRQERFDPSQFNTTEIELRATCFSQQEIDILQRHIGEAIREADAMAQASEPREADQVSQVDVSSTINNSPVETVEHVEPVESDTVYGDLFVDENIDRGVENILRQDPFPHPVVVQQRNQPRETSINETPNLRNEIGRIFGNSSADFMSRTQVGRSFEEAGLSMAEARRLISEIFGGRSGQNNASETVREAPSPSKPSLPEPEEQAKQEEVPVPPPTNNPISDMEL